VHGSGRALYGEGGAQLAHRLRSHLVVEQFFVDVGLAVILSSS